VFSRHSKWSMTMSALTVCFRITAGSHPVSADITVVTTSAVGAYVQALEGMRAASGNASYRVVDLARQTAERELAQALGPAHTRVFVAIGSQAAEMLSSQPMDVPVVQTMILRTEIGRGGDAHSHPRGSVCLELPAASLLAEVKRVFPGKTRLGVIRHPWTGGPSVASLQSQARQEGFSVRIVECVAREHLLKVFLSLQGEADLVWCIPESSLYDSATVKALILASLRGRLPILGFSESFVRAGAAMGVYPDFRDIGRQTAEMARQYLAGSKTDAHECPRICKVAVNRHILRLLGLRSSLPAPAAEDFVSFR
jgi:putative ABC transport system substrate-binding protein